MPTISYPPCFAAPEDLKEALERQIVLTLPGALIDGQFEAGASATCHLVHDPSTGKAIASFNEASRSQVERAIASATGALTSWRAAGPLERARVLRRIADGIEVEHANLVALQVFNSGKPRSEAEADVLDVMNTFRYYGDLCASLKTLQTEKMETSDPSYAVEMRYEPCGVAGLIVPWNFPMVTTAWKAAAALAAGCTIVLKPSELTPIAECALAMIIQKAGVPAGVVNVVLGAADVGAAIVRHPRIDKISFTGSTGVGKTIMHDAAERIARVSLELGGKSALVVGRNANMQMAVDYAVSGIFYNAGQMCSATSRILVHVSLHDEFLKRFSEAVRTLRIGGRHAGDAAMGPLISAAHRRRVQGFIDQAAADGIAPHVRGTLDEGTDEGYFMAPTVFTGVPVNHPLWTDEIFGPVACVRSYADLDEAIAIANDSEYGLVATVITDDPADAERMATELVAGLVWVNAPQIIFPSTSWGGFRKSGIGRELGRFGLRAFQEAKQVLRTL